MPNAQQMFCTLSGRIFFECAAAFIERWKDEIREHTCYVEGIKPPSKLDWYLVGGTPYDDMYMVLGGREVNRLICIRPNIDGFKKLLNDLKFVE